MSVAGSVLTNEPLSDEQLRALYAWIDAIPLSRPKRNIQRDFSDGVLLAEVVAAYFPALVELHNYGPANSMKQKVYNFETLNKRVLKKLGYNIPLSSIEDIVNCRPGAVESVLNNLQLKMARYREKKAMQGGSTPRMGEDSVVTSRSSPGRGNNNNGSMSARGRQQHHPGSGMKNQKSVMASVDEELLLEKEAQIRELQETVEILELKVAKLEQLVRLKDTKLQKVLGAK
jgi:hypothetical protein